MKYWAGPIFTAKPSYIILSTPICQQPNVDHADAKHAEFWKLTMHCSRSGREVQYDSRNVPLTTRTLSLCLEIILIL